VTSRVIPFIETAIHDCESRVSYNNNRQAGIPSVTDRARESAGGRERRRLSWKTEKAGNLIMLEVCSIADSRTESQSDSIPTLPIKNRARDRESTTAGAVIRNIDSALAAVTINLSRQVRRIGEGGREGGRESRAGERGATISTVCNRYGDIRVTCRSQPVH